jgi:hypothetical protein
MSLRPIVEGRQQDPLVKIRSRPWHRERSKQTEDSRAAADLRRAGWATFDVGRKTRGIGSKEVIEKEQVNEIAGARAIQVVADWRVRHIAYMT